MNNHLKALSLRSRKALVTLVAATGVLAGCNQDLDYLTLRSHVPFASASSSSAQTDVDRAQHLVDADGIPFLSINNVGKQRHPAWIALYALAYAGTEVYDERLAGLEDDLKFQACIDWLENNLRQDKHAQWVWQYHFDSTYNDISIKAPWSSAFAQATGIQALLVAYQRTGESRYIDLAKKAAQPLFTPLRAGGFLFEAGADIWFEEIPEPIENPGHILNGHMRVLLALADLYKATNDETTATWLQRGTDTLHRWLPKFDTGYWLRYDLNPRKEDLLFRFANPYGFPAHALAIDKITLRDPVSKAEVTVDVGSEMDTTGAARIAGTHWGQIEEVAGRSARKLMPAALDDTPDEMRAPHTYFYASLPGEWKDNLRDHWHELIIEYYDDTAANITIQQRSIAPGQIFRDMRDGDLHLNGAGHWRKWILPVRSSDLGYWVGAPYAEKHRDYLNRLSARDARFSSWAITASGYLNLVTRFTSNSEAPVTHKIEREHKQTQMLPIYSFDRSGVIMQHISESASGSIEDGSLNFSQENGNPVYSPFVVAMQLLRGENFKLTEYGIKDPKSISREPALNWLIDKNNFTQIDKASLYMYKFSNTYNDVYTNSPWPSAFGQAYVLKSLIQTSEDKLKKDLDSSISATARAYSVDIKNGGITSIDRSGQVFFEEVPNATHVLNAHLVSVPELSHASRLLKARDVQALANSGISTLKEKLHLFDTGYWLRYDQNPRKEILFQIDWLEGEQSPLIDEVFLQNPQTGRFVKIDVGAAGDAEGGSRISGTEWYAEKSIDGRSVRGFENGYQIREKSDNSGTRHNVYLVITLPEKEYYDFFDVPSHRLVIRYKDVSKGRFILKTQSINEGNRLAFSPLRGTLWQTEADGNWKETSFIVRPQDMGWFKGDIYQKFEVDQLTRIANLTNHWFFYQYAERHRYLLDAQQKGSVVINEGRRSGASSSVRLSVAAASATYSGFDFENSIDGDPENNYTAGIEDQPGFVVLQLNKKSTLAAVRLHWESPENRANHIVVSAVGPEKFAAQKLAEIRVTHGSSTKIDLPGGVMADAIRVDFGDFEGQQRLLLREIEVIEENEEKGGGDSSYQDPEEIYFESTDPRNPLHIFRLPITQRIKILADQMAVGLISDHEKILRYMKYIDSFRVGYPSNDSPDAVVIERIGSCGTFSNTLVAFAATQGIKGRIISLFNYPENSGHAVAELFVNNKWTLYDPTYGTFYVKNQGGDGNPLSYSEIQSAYRAQPDSVRRVTATYRSGLDKFTGKEIFLGAAPAGVIGLDKPMIFPLYLTYGSHSVLERSAFGNSNQGADFLGASSTNQNQLWTLSGLTEGSEYEFVITPHEFGADQFDGSRHFELKVGLDGGTLSSEAAHRFDFSHGRPSSLRIKFLANQSEVRLTLTHPYLGPGLRYISIERYEINQVTGLR